MIENINLEQWLRSKSTSTEVVGAERIFTHFNGDRSIVVTKETWRDDLLPLSNPHLNDFYQNYLGASIGGSALMIGTPVEGGLRLSQGFSLPDFEQIRSRAIQYVIKCEEEDDLFMVGSGWMFFYSYNRSPENTRLRCFDRDFHTVSEDRSFQQVLEDWWRLLLENSIR